MEVSSRNPYEKIKEIKEVWTTTNEEKPLELNIEGFMACLSPDPLCITKHDDQLYKEFHGMKIKENPRSSDYV